MIADELFITKEFERIISPLNTEVFFKEFWSQKFLYVDGGGGRFENLFSWKELNETLETHRLEYPRIRLAKDGFTIDPKGYCHYVSTKIGINIPYISCIKLNEILSEGATLVLDAVDELNVNVKALTQIFEFIFREAVHVNAYVAWGNTTGLDIHWDDHDVMVLQVFGKKKWEIYGDTIKHPLIRNILSELQKPKKPIFEKIINAGDILYIPRGHWHNVIPCAEPSIHLTFAIKNRNGIDFANWMSNRLMDDDFFRKDIPHLTGGEGLRRYAKTFNEKIQNFFESCSIDEYLDQHKQSVLVRPRFSLPDSVMDRQLNLNKKLVFNISWAVGLLIDDQNHIIRLQYEGNQLNFDWNFKPLFSLLVDRSHCTVAEAFEVIGSNKKNEVEDVIRKLLATGLVALVD